MKLKHLVTNTACLALATLWMPAMAQPAEFADEELAACVTAAVQQANIDSPAALVSLTCNGMGIEDATGISALTGLQTLSLFGNRLAQIDTSALVELKILNLANNRLKQVDLANNTQLQTLYLFGNALTGLNLESNRTLKKLKAEKNKILKVVFPQSTTLQKVYLFNNEMEDIKIDSLKSLKFIDVRSNPMPDEVYDYLDGFSGVRASHDGNTEEWR